MRASWQTRFRPLARLAALTILLATTALAGCRAAIVDALPNKDFTFCTIMADAPEKAHAKIVGASHFTCDGGGADSITMTVTLQQLGAQAQWLTLATDTFVAHGDNTSRARTLGTRTRSVSANCTTGKFRTVMHAVEDSKGKTATFDNHSVTVSNPCNL